MTANPSVPSPSPFGPWFGSDSSSDAEEDFDLTLPPPTTSGANPSQTIEALLQSGREELGVDLGFLARIDPGPGTHTVTVSSGSHRTLSEGAVHDLAHTYCRTVVVASSPLALHDAPNQEWADDPAYERFGLDTYLGTKIVVDDHLYGTVCFADVSPRATPFSVTDRDVLNRLAASIENILPPSSQVTSRTNPERNCDLLRRVQEISQVGGWELHLATHTLTWTQDTYRLHDLPTSYEPDLDSAIDFYAPEAQPVLRSAINDCSERGLPFDETLPLVTAEGSRRYVRARGRPYRENGSITRITGTIQDVTEKTEMHYALQEERDLLNRVVETSPSAIGIALIDEEGQILEANSAFTDLCGYDAEEMTGQSLNVLWGPDTSERVLRNFWNALEAGRRHEGETVAYRKDGTPFINRWSIAPVRNAEQTVTHWISIQRDVTAQRETDKRLLEIRDEERRRINQELHDELGGLLTSLQLTVELARMETDADSVPIDYLDEIEKYVDDVASATRTISRRLHPDALDEEGIACAVPTLIRSLQKKHGIEIRCTCEMDPDATLASSIEMIAYQVVQEALLCALHQFSPSTLSVTLQTEPRQLCADVLCRNALLPDSAGEATDCDRLHRMSEWVHRFDGEFTVSHEAETDTRIRATLPLTVAPLPG